MMKIYSYSDPYGSVSFSTSLIWIRVAKNHTKNNQNHKNIELLKKEITYMLNAHESAHKSQKNILILYFLRKKNYFKNLVFYLCLIGSVNNETVLCIRNQDPYRNETDTKHWIGIYSRVGPNIRFNGYPSAGYCFFEF